MESSNPRRYNFPPELLKAKPTADFYQELGLSKTRFYGLLRKHGIAPPGKQILPNEQNNIRKALGFPPLWEY